MQQFLLALATAALLSMTLPTIVLADSAAEIEQRIEGLLERLTLEEKASLTSGRDAWSTQPIERLGIPSIWVADGPHGLRRAPTTDTWGYGDQLPATCFPTASALAATWDRELLREVGAALGTEAQALGVNVLLGPGANIKRSVLGGRNFEYFSEDPLLSGTLAAAYIDGVQGRGVGTSLKHYAANNVETARMWTDSAVDDRTLQEIYLRSFEIAVREAQPWTVMACYNRVQGEYCTASEALLQDTLKDAWGFAGIVVSDWDAVIDRVAGIRAGMHLEMPGKPGHLTNAQVVAAVENGELDEARLDEIVRDILRVVLRADAARDPGDQNLEAHHALARRVAGEAAVLLKNDGDVLPVATSAVERIAVIGEFAEKPRYQGNGSSEVKPPRVDSFLDVVRREFGDTVEVTYAPGYSLDDDDDQGRIAAAQELAAAADVALVLVGLPQHYESEGVDRTHINLPPAQDALVQAVAAAQPRTAVLLTNGSAVAMPWVNDVPAILEGWLGGQAGAGGVADVVFGRVNPSGKLAETFPRRLEDTPAFLNFPGEDGEVLYGERIFVGYRWYDARAIEPLFPFGHGLSYTRFRYDDLIVSAPEFDTEDDVRITVTITNAGEQAGQEVVQLYLADPEASVQRPPSELRGFRKVDLKPGESRKVSFVLNADDLAYYSTRHGRWLAESGVFEVRVGASSRDVRLRKEISYASTERIPYAVDEYTFFREVWEDPQLQPLVIELMPRWLGENTPEGRPLTEADIHPFLQDQPLIKFPFFTVGEIDADDVRAFVAAANTLTFVP